jgi:hypothetical protein
VGTVYNTLIRRLDGPVRATIDRRADAMMRQIAYLSEINDRRLVFVSRRGWTLDRLAVLCSLNSFYQTVIGPLASSARRETRIGLGERIPINYGEEIRFDGERAAEMRALHSAFLRLVGATGLPNTFLHANHADDLIFILSEFLHASSGD